MSEEKMEHSPLPWRVSGKQSIRGFGEGSWIAKANWYRGPANAQFIVTACNSHYENKAAIAELVEALDRVVTQINDYERANNLAPPPPRTECWDCVAYAKSVLAKHKAVK